MKPLNHATINYLKQGQLPHMPTNLSLYPLLVFAILLCPFFPQDLDCTYISTVHSGTSSIILWKTETKMNLESEKPCLRTVSSS